MNDAMSAQDTSEALAALIGRITRNAWAVTFTETGTDETERTVEVTLTRAASEDGAPIGSGTTRLGASRSAAMMQALGKAMADAAEHERRAAELARVQDVHAEVERAGASVILVPDAVGGWRASIDGVHAKSYVSAHQAVITAHRRWRYAREETEALAHEQHACQEAVSACGYGRIVHGATRTHVLHRDGSLAYDAGVHPTREDALDAAVRWATRHPRTVVDSDT